MSEGDNANYWQSQAEGGCCWGPGGTSWRVCGCPGCLRVLKASLCRSLAGDYLAKATVGVKISPDWIGGAYRSGNTETRELETQGCGRVENSTDNFRLLAGDDESAKTLTSTFQNSRSNDVQGL